MDNIFVFFKDLPKKLKKVLFPSLIFVQDGIGHRNCFVAPCITRLENYLFIIKLPYI